MIRGIKSETLETIFNALSSECFANGELSLDKIRIDSTVVKSNISEPSDSQLLNDGIRVLNRLLSKSREMTGIKIRFSDKRKESKLLAFRIFNAKKAEKVTIYPKLLHVVNIVLKQVGRALDKVKLEGVDCVLQRKWITQVEYYRDLLLKVVDQTVRRVIYEESVPSMVFFDVNPRL